MAASMSFALTTLRRRGGADDLLHFDAFEQLCRDAGHRWRERVFTPLVTLRLFLLQVLHGNTAIVHLRQLTGLCFCGVSYCEARIRLPLQALQSLLQSMTQSVQDKLRSKGDTPRVFVVDGSSFSMPDTPPLREHFGLPTGQKLGVGYPVSTIIGLIDRASGLIVQMLSLPLFSRDMRGVTTLHGSLQKGDILVGDRAFCSFCHFVLLSAGGVFGCFRLHQRRPTDRVGIVRWAKPALCPRWMSLGQFASMPAFIDVRVVRHAIVQPGFRTKVIFIATTLTEEMGWSDSQVIDLYARRWEIETCFAHLKTTMKMNVLKCKSVDGVMKELCVYLIVYNLARLLMLQWARANAVDVRRVSLVDAVRLLAVRGMGLCGVSRLILNPARPSRSHPRAVRRRTKQFDLLNCPRNQWKHPEKAVKKA